MTARYAIYFVPSEDHPLYTDGQHLLSWDARLGEPLAQLALEGIDTERLVAITNSPRLYSFHATLKPPFQLVEQQSAEALHRDAEKFTARQKAFNIPELEIRVIDRFIAIVPSNPCTALHILADSCVRAFDGFRAPPNADELEKRRAVKLTPTQEKLLKQWGYPYVFEEFRPHFSLTERIDDAAERDRVLQAMREASTPESLTDVTVDSISILSQPDTRTPFQQTARFQFGS
jgi:2'-5' RNA ligase